MQDADEAVDAAEVESDEDDEEDDEEMDSDADATPGKVKPFTKASPFTDSNQDWLKLATGESDDEEESDDQPDEFDLGTCACTCALAIFPMCVIFLADEPNHFFV